VCARETAAAAVCLGRKTTGRGPHVSEVREGKAGWAGRRPLGRLASGFDAVERGRWAVAGSKTRNGPKFKKKFFLNFN
jgi:hypothetical protein